MIYDTEIGVFAKLTEMSKADQIPRTEIAIAKPEKKR